MFGMSMQELVVIGIIAILLFGKRLPEVARTLGGHYRDFKKSLTEIQSTVDLRDIYSSKPTSRSTQSRKHEDYDDYEESTAPKFEPPPSEPTVESSEQA